MSTDPTEAAEATDGTETTVRIFERPKDLPQVVQEALTADELARLTHHQLEILSILIDLGVNEENGTSTDDVADIVQELQMHGEDLGMYGPMSIAKLLVASAWHRYGYDSMGTPGFNLVDETGEGGCSSYEVSLLLGADARCYLADSCDVKYLDPDRYNFGVSGRDEHGQTYHEIFVSQGERIRRPGPLPQMSALFKTIVMADVLCEDYERLRRAGEKLLDRSIPSRLPSTSV